MHLEQMQDGNRRAKRGRLCALHESEAIHGRRCFHSPFVHCRPIAYAIACRISNSGASFKGSEFCTLYGICGEVAKRSPTAEQGALATAPRMLYPVFIPRSER